MVTPRSTRGHGLVFAGEPQAGLADTEEALELARMLGHPESQAYALWHRSEALTACGRPGDGQRSAQEALAIAERLGHRGWTATALRAVGIAHDAVGDLAAAEAAFRRSLALAADRLPLFGCWAAARLALVLIGQGRSAEAEPHVAWALERGPALGHYEARLARAELAAARADPDATAIATDALTRAQAGGHLAGTARLRQLRA